MGGEQAPAGRARRAQLTLTFDDGPDPVWTSAVLDALGAAKVHATFFMIAECVERAPAAARAVIAAGHGVELHCYRHLRHTELDEQELEQDVTSALAVLAGVGAEAAWWRPPWGICTPATDMVAARHGLRLIRWDIDTHDWRGDDAEAMLLRADEQMRDGGVVLMHDGLGPGARRAGCRNTIDLLAPLIERARALDLAVGALDEAGAVPAAIARSRAA